MRLTGFYANFRELAERTLARVRRDAAEGVGVPDCSECWVAARMLELDDELAEQVWEAAAQLMLDTFGQGRGFIDCLAAVLHS